jgi:hypothetical protein
MSKALIDDFNNLQKICIEAGINSAVQIILDTSIDFEWLQKNNFNIEKHLKGFNNLAEKIRKDAAIRAKQLLNQAN